MYKQLVEKTKKDSPFIKMLLNLNKTFDNRSKLLMTDEELEEYNSLIFSYISTFKKVNDQNNDSSDSD